MNADVQIYRQRISKKSVEIEVYEPVMKNELRIAIHKRSYQLLSACESISHIPKLKFRSEECRKFCFISDE